MTLKEIHEVPGAPCNRTLRGLLDVMTVESEVLSGNPLGDPAQRPLYVYRPPNIDDSGEYASIYVLQGFIGQLDHR